MNLEDVIRDLEIIDNSLTICASHSPNWTQSSEAGLRPSDQVQGQYAIPYFLEVSVAKNVLRAWLYVRGGRVPSLDEKCEAVIYYAQNDAYLIPEEEHKVREMVSLAANSGQPQGSASRNQPAADGPA